MLNKKWQTWHISGRFIEAIRRKFGFEEFTLKEAYKLYVRVCMQESRKQYYRKSNKRVLRRHYYPMWRDYWMQMNVRQHCAAAAYRGIMVRVSPGVYRISTGPWSSDDFRRPDRQ